jgi:hypothetical protein
MNRFTYLFLPFLLAGSHNIYAQSCGNLQLTLKAEIPSVCADVTLTMKEDNTNRPFLYVAVKDSGLRVYNVADIASPKLVSSITDDKFDTLHVMNITQEGRYLYLTLGNSFTTAAWQSPGMAIVDIADPAQPVVTDVYRYPFPEGGGGIALVDGNYAYLGAMTHGLVILDISDKQNIKYVSELQLDRLFPVANPDTVKYNARGMAFRDNIVYLAFDAGGFRTIDVSDKLHPIEIGKYSNHVLDNLPRAYNNVVLLDTLAFVSTDYCGIEVLNIADPRNIRQVSWWNPWNCQSNPFNWLSSPGHANELEYSKECKQLFVATGKSDLYVLDASNPTHLDSCANYGGVDNGIGTWGVHLGEGRIYLSYVCAFGVPFTSFWTGVKILSYVPCQSSAVLSENSPSEFRLYPTIARDEVTVEGIDTRELDRRELSLVNSIGEEMKVSLIANGASAKFDVSFLPPGIYFVRIGNRNALKFFKSPY